MIRIIVGTLILLCVVSSKGSDSNWKSSWFDDIEGRVEETTRQYTRETLRYAVQKAMESQTQIDKNDDAHSFRNKNGKTIGEILDTNLIESEEHDKREREAYTYLILLVFGLVILAIILVFIFISCYIYSIYVKYQLLLSALIWISWVIFTAIKYHEKR